MHGAARGSWLAMKRLSKCHPLGSHGYDPVPSSAPRPSTSLGTVPSLPKDR
jgi:uncharacterized protein